MKKKVGLLGGTFNPPHIGHLVIAEQALEKAGLDEIRFLPNHVPPHKQADERVSPQQRVNMLEKAIQGHPRFSIEKIELEREGASYTFDTIKLLTEREGNTEFSFIIGGDMIEYLPKWHRIDELQEMVKFIGVNRPAYTHETPYDVHLIEVPAIDLSSSYIRDTVKKGQTVRYLVPDDVYRYIKEEGLYE
ncbi:nicotinate-nucleotide adenylyltransferase [Bacillus sp. KH172YL63]|uniref:nicotinate-nucleotide adenylyltransferase n=1 Tax=Bacillus sp. KH172YL63 TaxID=2709784 RepID=UPI0013E50710|nr:nicotinate-nucleotide adenylyltransferase [Bacillus sp. KH172YL63]BCB04901.1 putative nicotinate-nucleotide adenylyltransferase [Bacillus sp. KH172YL63]